MNQHPPFSAVHRAEQLQQAATHHFDLIVIGGGITGAGIALDAATRGLKTLLLEKQDFGAGTSSRSTKLIHGGLRYLKQLEFALVHEVGTERALLHHNAPHLVRPETMLLPIIEQGSLGKQSTSLGLFLYDILAGVGRKERRKMHSTEDTLALEPLLRADVVLGGGMYFEYQTDDARLTIEVLKTAQRRGAFAFNYAEATGFIYENGKLKGVKVLDHHTNAVLPIYAKKVVNAAGPWVDELRIKDHSLNNKYLHLTKGVHIVVPRRRLPIRQAVYFDVSDGRMIFAIPRGKITYIGTTDTNYYRQQIERPQATLEDITYLLNAVNYMFPRVQLVLADIESSWTGLRPLIHQEGRSPSELSRKDELFFSKSGLISIAGGKLTGFRRMAKRVTDAVVKDLHNNYGMPVKGCVTDEVVLSGGRFKHPELVPKYIAWLAKKHADLGISRSQFRDLVYKYGRNTHAIIRIYTELYAHRSLPIEQGLLLAELHYGVQYEMVTSLSDFLIRRTGRLYFERPEIEPYLSILANEIADILALSPEQKNSQLKEFDEEYWAVLSFAGQPHSIR